MDSCGLKVAERKVRVLLTILAEFSRISSKFIKDLQKCIIFLTKIFNSTLDLKYWPRVWKLATNTFISKPNKNPKNINSYRPISFSPKPSRIKVASQRTIRIHSIHSTIQKCIRVIHSSTSSWTSFKFLKFGTPGYHLKAKILSL